MQQNRCYFNFKFEGKRTFLEKSKSQLLYKETGKCSWFGCPCVYRQAVSALSSLRFLFNKYNALRRTTQIIHTQLIRNFEFKTIQINMFWGVTPSLVSPESRIILTLSGLIIPDTLN